MATPTRVPTAARLLLTATLGLALALGPATALGMPRAEPALRSLGNPEGLPEAVDAHRIVPALAAAAPAGDASVQFVPNPDGCLAAPGSGACTFHCEYTEAALVSVEGPPGAAVTVTCASGLSATCTTGTTMICLLEFTGMQGFNGAGTCTANALAVLAGCGNPSPFP